MRCWRIRGGCWRGVGREIGVDLFASALLVRVLAAQAAVFEKNSLVVDVIDGPIAEIPDAELAIARIDRSEAIDWVPAGAIVWAWARAATTRAKWAVRSRWPLRSFRN